MYYIVLSCGEGLTLSWEKQVINTLQTTFKLNKCRYRICECFDTAMLYNEGPYRHSTFHTELHSKHSQKKWLLQARDYHHVTLSSIPIL